MMVASSGLLRFLLIAEVTGIVSYARLSDAPRPWIDSVTDLMSIFETVSWSPFLWDAVSHSYEDSRGKDRFGKFYHNFTRKCGEPVLQLVE